MSPRFLLGRENVPCVAEVVNRSLKADCIDFIQLVLALHIVYTGLYSELTHPEVIITKFLMVCQKKN